MAPFVAFKLLPTDINASINTVISDCELALPGHLRELPVQFNGFHKHKHWKEEMMRSDTEGHLCSALSLQDHEDAGKDLLSREQLLYHPSQPPSGTQHVS